MESDHRFAGLRQLLPTVTLVVTILLLSCAVRPMEAFWLNLASSQLSHYLFLNCEECDSRALRYCENALRGVKGAPRGVLVKAKILSLCGQPVPAMSLLRREGMWPPGDAMFQSVLRKSLLDNNADEPAFELLNEGACWDGTAVRLMIRKEHDSHTAKTRKVYELVTETCPQSAPGVRASYRLSRMASREGDLGEASAWIERLLEHSADEPEAWAELARIQLELGDYEEAIHSAERSLSFDSSLQNLAARAFRGITYLRLGKTDLALLDLECVRVAGTDSVYNLFSLAQAYYLVGESEISIEILKDVLTIDPSYAPAADLYDELSSESDWQIDFLDTSEGVQ